MGLTRSGVRFVSQFRLLRRAGRINEFVSIYVNIQQQIIHIACDGGRICRPLIIVENEQSRVRESHMRVSYCSIPSSLFNDGNSDGSAPPSS